MSPEPDVRFRIRPAVSSDLAEVASLYRDWLAEDRIVGMLADSEADLAKKLNDYFLVAEENGRIVGFTTCEEKRVSPGEWTVLAEGGPYISVEDLYVAAPFRSIGIGSALLQKAFSIAAERGIAHSAIYSSSKDWSRLVPFYKSFGLDVWYVQFFGPISRQ